MRLRAPGGVQPALHLVRQRIHLQGRPADDAGRDRARGASPVPRRRTRRDHWWRAHAAGTRSAPADGQLLISGYTVLLETSGERLLDKVPDQVVKIVDVKCPHSGEADTFRHENLLNMTLRDEAKFVLASRVDYEFARDFIRQHELSARVGSVILSPAFRKDATGSRDASHCLLDPRELA